MPKGLSEVTNRRTGNAMAKRKRKENDKQWSTEKLHRKLKIEQHESLFKFGLTRQSDCKYLVKQISGGI
jgi:hypothetical protein